MYDYGDVGVDAGALEAVAAMGRRLHMQQCIVADLEDELKRAKKELAQIEEQDLPELLDEVGLSEFTLADGTRYGVKESVHASISKANEDAAMQWLHDSGNAGLIKSMVTVSFSKGQEAQAQAIYDLIAQQEFVGSMGKSRKVEPSTLRAFVKRQLEAGADIPLETFGVFKRRKVEIKK